ncbi:hypothetical protein CMQ_1249 [Grosmannia clavigera kw1407]|uniref:Uncharacterized protein n=1 Tax=Grosmannia clavigera (strain kw1407 / UAMH 11150) TaxID=655863 RepID=F0XDQ4_GROCL|nr:uncharacterized protein CMQ_1249 [Grosmannia clavigera kw1407]EFX04321.1 hypothetical protein CMQ_1249 [Grosmannia clavigera kw1407]
MDGSPEGPNLELSGRADSAKGPVDMGHPVSRGAIPQGSTAARDWLARGIKDSTLALDAALEAWPMGRLICCLPPALREATRLQQLATM